jgi:hypothetical protein
MTNRCQQCQKDLDTKDLVIEVLFDVTFSCSFLLIIFVITIATHSHHF